MTKYYAPHWVWRFSFVIGHLLLGYAVSAPARLSIYFFPKPGIDIATDTVLMVGLVILCFRWLKVRTPLLIPGLSVLALVWMRLDYILFSKSEWFSIISYLLMASWALIFCSFWNHYKQYINGVNQAILALLIGGVGFLWGLYDQHFVLSAVMACLFLVTLPYAGVNPYSGHRVLSEWFAIGILVLPLYVAVNLESPAFYDSQQKHHDKVVFSHQTRYQTLDVTEWKGNYWFYQDNINHYSSIDSWLYYEPFVHPAMQLVRVQPKVLIVGGENGMLAHYLSRLDPSSVELIPIDEEYLEVARTNPFYRKQNGDVFELYPIEVREESAFRWLNKSTAAYDIIFVDVPDPIDIELNQYYTHEFYALCHSALKNHGLLVTQSGSPYFATAAFQAIEKTMQAAEFSTASYHNQVLSLGEWAWTLGSKSDHNPGRTLKNLSFEGVTTQWLNQEAIQMMLSFGKPYVSVDRIEVNTIQNPVIHRLYNQGNYQLN